MELTVTPHYYLSPTAKYSSTLITWKLVFLVHCLLWYTSMLGLHNCLCWFQKEHTNFLTWTVYEKYTQSYLLAFLLYSIYTYFFIKVLLVLFRASHHGKLLTIRQSPLLEFFLALVVSLFIYFSICYKLSLFFMLDIKLRYRTVKQQCKLLVLQLQNNYN